MKLPEGKTRLDLIKQGLGVGGGIAKRGRMLVSIDRLREDPRNERRTFRNMEGLIASVKAVGLIEAITVTPDTDKDGTPAYRIVTGHRRYRAAKAAKLETVEVLIRDPEDEPTRRVKSIVSNVQREDIGPVEMAEGLQSLLDEDKSITSQDELAKAIGKDKSWVSGMLRILSLPSELQRKVGTSQQSVPYESMIRIARLDDPSQQRELVEAALGGATHRQIRERIDQFKGKPTKTPPERENNPKPKRVYHTDQDVTIIVQSENYRLTHDRVVTALEQALRQARKAA